MFEDTPTPSRGRGTHRIAPASRQTVPKPRKGRQSSSPRREPGVTPHRCVFQKPRRGDTFLGASIIAMMTQSVAPFGGFEIRKGACLTPGSAGG